MYYRAISVSAAPVITSPSASNAAQPAPAAATGVFDRFVLGKYADAICFGPGATLFVAGVLLALNAIGGAAASLATTLAMSLVVLFVGPHYAATYRRAYTSRRIIAAHPVVTLVVPVVLAVAAFFAVRRPTTFGIAFFATYVLWSGYHYSGQSLGLAMLYPLRQGARLAPREKRLLSVPLYFSWLLSVAGLFRMAAPARSAAHEMVRRAYSGPALPAWVPPVGLGLLALSFVAVAIVARGRRARGVPLPWPTYAVLSAQVIWFSVGLYYPLVSITLAPVFHSLQYLGLTSWHANHGPGASARRFAGYAASLVVLGLIVNPGASLLLGHGRDAADALVIAAALTTFVNLHHFLLDGRIWRMREKQVAQSLAA
jgi:hypothetical protein